MAGLVTTTSPVRGEEKIRDCLPSELGRRRKERRDALASPAHSEHQFQSQLNAPRTAASEEWIAQSDVGGLSDGQEADAAA
jgi:hypothetical protein